MILDNCSAYNDIDKWLLEKKLEYIHIIYLPPNATSKAQPMDQGIISWLKTEYRYKIFFLSGIKDEDYTAIKDQCDKKSFDESVLDLRTKAIKLGKAGGSKRFKRRTNKVTTEEDDEKDNQQVKIKLLVFPLETWKLLSPEVKSMYGMLRKAAREGTIVKLE